PILRDWAAPGKPVPSRMAAIASIARLDKDNKQITQQVTAYLNEPRFPIRESAIVALGNRGDATAIPALESLLHVDDLSIEMVPIIKDKIAKLQKRPPSRDGSKSEDSDDDDDTSASSGASSVNQRLDKLERLVQEMSERLKAMDARLPAPKKPERD